MSGTRRQRIGATTYFDIGSSTYFLATRRHRKRKQISKGICAFCASWWLEFGFVGKREGEKRVFAGQLEFRANV